MGITHMTPVRSTTWDVSSTDQKRLVKNTHHTCGAPKGAQPHLPRAASAAMDSSTFCSLSLAWSWVSVGVIALLGVAVQGPKVPLLLLGVGELAFRAAEAVLLVLMSPGVTLAEADADVERDAEPGASGLPMAAGRLGRLLR